VIERRDIQPTQAQMLGVVIDGIEQQQVHFFQGVRHIPLDQHGQILGFRAVRCRCCSSEESSK
jgi:hypothetical protein